MKYVFLAVLAIGAIVIIALGIAGIIKDSKKIKDRKKEDFHIKNIEDTTKKEEEATK